MRLAFFVFFFRLLTIVFCLARVFQYVSVIFAFSNQVFSKNYECKFTKIQNYTMENTAVACELSNVYFNQQNNFNILLNETAIEIAAEIDEDYVEDGKTRDFVMKLKFKDSKLSSVPNFVFQIFPFLEIFDVSNTLLKNVHAKTFQNATNLLQLFMQNNQITKLDGYIFRDTKKLKILDLSYNEITKIHSKAFFALENLVDLKLSNNKISGLEDDVFADLGNLKSVGLENNHLTMIASRLFTENHKKLETISLNFNAIEEISPHVFDNLKSLRFLMLSGNKCVDLNFKRHIIPENTSIKMELNQCLKNYRKIFPTDSERFNITKALSRLETSNKVCEYEFTSVNESMADIQKQLERLIKS